MTSTLEIIITFVFQLACMLFLIRFLLQASGADFYNPISQAIVKGTDPLCSPLRAIMPRTGQFDLASLLLAWLIATAGLFAITFVKYGVLAPIGPALWRGFIDMLLVLTQFYWFTILIVIIASFIAQGNYHPALQLLSQLLEPLLAPIRKIMPDFGPIDLSPMVLILIIIVVENLLRQAAG